MYELTVVPLPTALLGVEVSAGSPGSVLEAGVVVPPPVRVYPLPVLPPSVTPLPVVPASFPSLAVVITTIATVGWLKVAVVVLWVVVIVRGRLGWWDRMVLLLLWLLWLRWLLWWWCLVLLVWVPLHGHVVLGVGQQILVRMGQHLRHRGHRRHQQRLRDYIGKSWR